MAPVMYILVRQYHSAWFVLEGSPLEILISLSGALAER